MEQSQPQQSQNHMITPIEKIPLKTSGNANDEMNDDPMIRDVLNEFEKELAITETTNKYKINDQIPVQQIQQPIMQPMSNDRIRASSASARSISANREETDSVLSPAVLSDIAARGICV
jgi:hypothetical protein